MTTEELYEFAENTPADWHPMGTDYIYLTSEYNRAKRFGLPLLPIRVQSITTGEIIGTVPLPGEE